MLIHLTGAGGKEITNLDKLETQMEFLKAVIRNSFRRGDLFTTYSKSQYIVVLIANDQLNCERVFERCRKRWEQTEGASGELSYAAKSLVKMIDLQIKE